MPIITLCIHASFEVEIMLFKAYLKDLVKSIAQVVVDQLSQEYWSTGSDILSYDFCQL